MLACTAVAATATSHPLALPPWMARLTSPPATKVRGELAVTIPSSALRVSTMRHGVIGTNEFSGPLGASEVARAWAVAPAGVGVARGLEAVAVTLPPTTTAAAR